VAPEGRDRYTSEPMNVIAFDTCFRACSVAVLWHEPGPTPDAPREHLVSRYEEMATGQAERLMPMIDEVLRESGRKLQDLDAIAVTEGPGTFTGVRVGVAAARGLALATGLPIRATTSLHVMAHRALAEVGRAFPEGLLAVSVDARGGQVFVQFFEATDGTPLTQAAIMEPKEAAAMFPERPLLCVGSGGQMVVEAALQSGRVVEADLPNLQPDARYLTRLAPQLPERKPLIPLYLRPPDAKPQIGKSLPRA